MNAKKSHSHTTDIDPKIDPAFKAIASEKKLLLGFLRDLFQYLKLPEPINLTYNADSG